MPLPTADYASHWTSMAGALAGTLRSLGGTLTAADVNSRSGHAFRFAVAPSLTEDGAIGADGPNRFAVAPVADLYASLGWRLSTIERDSSSADFARVRQQALTGLRASTAAGRAAIVYGVQLPEFGIVRAVEADALLVSTAVSTQFGQRVPLHQWPAPGNALPLRVFLLDERTRETLALGPLLRFVIAYARNGDPPTDVGVRGAATGFAAFERWIALLEGEARIAASGHAYCLQTLQQARHEASAFLRAAGAGTAVDRPLRAAAVAYTAESVALAQLITLFPYPNGGDVVSPGSRHIAALYARRVYDAEREAVGHIAGALGL
jgi:hypothetical protein